MPDVPLGPVSLERMVRAVAKVRERLLRASAALEAQGVPYAVAGDNAVAYWVARVDESAVRFTPEVEILLRRDDFHAAATALEWTGFIHGQSAGTDTFVESPAARGRDAVKIVFAGEKRRAQDVLEAPDVTESEPGPTFRVLSLAALVRMKLSSFRLIDRLNLRDLLDVGLIDESWCGQLPPALAGWLRQLLESPEN